MNLNSQHICTLNIVSTSLLFFIHILQTNIHKHQSNHITQFLCNVLLSIQILVKNKILLKLTNILALSVCSSSKTAAKRVLKYGLLELLIPGAAVIRFAIAFKDGIQQKIQLKPDMLLQTLCVFVSSRHPVLAAVLHNASIVKNFRAKKLIIAPDYIRPVIRFFDVPTQFERVHCDDFIQEQEARYRAFLKQMRFECGTITPGYPEMDQKDIYWKMEPVKNELYANEPEYVFEIRFSQVEGYMELQTTELLQLLSIYYKLQLDVKEFVALLKYNSLPEKSIASLELLNVIKPNLSPDEALVAILVCLTQRFQREGFDDNYNIQVQHVFSKIFNDRSPNQRAAMSCAWSVITEKHLVDQRHDKLYFQAMVSGDSKMYETVLRQLKAKEPGSLLQATCWLLTHSPSLMRDSSYEKQKRNYELAILALNRVFLYPVVNFEILSGYVQQKAQAIIQLIDAKSLNGIYL
ncbi:Transmembrane_domain-containing protein [Hexamita inflata]|uniref:Transmembrane domain-containing protein n=1 Tax=Hexamita inflata TaxID=28002 RepID=A0AA86U5W2_9EUKA|nr:Transmembrane domain-containing protein [Hexamita inflata]